MIGCDFGQLPSAFGSTHETAAEPTGGEAERESTNGDETAAEPTGEAERESTDGDETAAEPTGGEAERESTDGDETAAEPTGGEAERECGTGGKGKGALDHSTPRGRCGTRAFHARHAAYAAPPRIPIPATRFTDLRIRRIVSCARRYLPSEGLTEAVEAGRLDRLMHKETMAFAALLGLLLM